MIIFDLDGTLADCEHRRHFVDPTKDLNLRCIKYKDGSYDVHSVDDPTLYSWKPDWQSFYEACDKDTPIEPVIDILEHLKRDTYGYSIPEIQIWTGRCESVREKTLKWLSDHYIHYLSLKMRPIGDHTPDDQLKERWLDEEIAKGNKIDFVFDDRVKVVDMYRKRGIFVFNCCQHDEEF
jgi:FMN phosphatase YigB (HAD superfamily)